MHTFRRSARILIAAFLLVLSVAPVAGAKGGPPHPPGEEPGEEVRNNLSVPAIFVGTSPFVVNCTPGDDSLDPTGAMGVLIGEIIDHPDYWVQGVAQWQSDCANANAGEVAAAASWGDNLTSAPLKQGTPIRTEIGFLADPSVYPMPGYTVVKLDPTLLDRESHYGTLGIEESPYPEVRVWVAGTTLDITSTDGQVVVADEILYIAEINSTGRVVYGFNWQNPVAGEYTITVHAPGIELTSTDAGTLVDSDDDGIFDTVTLDVNVGNKGGGGSGNGGKGGGGGGKGVGGGGGRGGSGGGPGGPGSSGIQ